MYSTLNKSNKCLFNTHTAEGTVCVALHGQNVKYLRKLYCGTYHRLISYLNSS